MRFLHELANCPYCTGKKRRKKREFLKFINFNGENIYVRKDVITAIRPEKLPDGITYTKILMNNSLVITVQHSLQDVLKMLGEKTPAKKAKK